MTAPPRRTRQREAVSELLDSLTEFSTAQQLHAELTIRGHKVGLATVYRTLTAFADVGEIDVLRTPDGELAYRRCSIGHHHHLVCRECGHAVEISTPELERILSELAADHEFTDIIHDLEFFGVCAQCAGSARG